MERGNNGGVNLLARVFQERVKGLSATAPLLDFGTVQSNMSIITNAFPLPIPYKDYIICHSVRSSVSPGDRVLAAWVGDDLVVIDIIVKVSEETK